MEIKYQSKDYRPEDVEKRYVRIDGHGIYHFCEVGKDQRFDIRQGTVQESEIPETVRNTARKRSRRWPSYVEWPL